MRHTGIVAKRLFPPETAVTPAPLGSLHALDAVTPQALLLALDSDKDSARRAVARYEARVAPAVVARELAMWLEVRFRHTFTVGRDEPFAVTTAAWQLVAHIELRAHPDQLPSVLRLPCEGCGYVFDSRFHYDNRIKQRRYARFCGRCIARPPAQPNPRQGGLIVGHQGAYPRHRPGQTLDATWYQQQVLCDHPACLVVFMASRPNDTYCPDHRGLHRETIRRLRARLPSKLTRYSFHVAAPEYVPFTYHLDTGEAVVISDEGRFARDEDELRELAAQAQPGGLLVARDHHA